MNLRRPPAILAVLLALSACGPAPTAAPPSSSAGRPTIAAPTTAATGPAGSAAAELDDLVASMAAFVMAGDKDGYLSLVDRSDAVFATEHTRWADEWSGPHPVTEYGLDLENVRVDGAGATGDVTVTWGVEGDPSGEGVRSARFAARFTQSDAGAWQYAGEAWVSTEIPRFVIRVAPGLEAESGPIEADLPTVYDHVTSSLGYEPTGTMQIKLYAEPEPLVANTLLSLPIIAGWNEPGEALKLVHRPNGPPLTGTIAHELTHFVGFDRAGTKRTRMPWWLDEGIATFVATELDGAPAQDRLAQVIQWNAEGALAPWEAMAVFEDAPIELWTYAYPQGYAMVRFVTERFGRDERNAWLAAMATEMDIDEATPAVLGRSFDELDAEFRAWLTEQA